MKYAILGPQKGINRVLDAAPSHQLLDGVTVEQITDEQAATVQAGRTSDPRVFYFLIDGELQSMQQRMEAQRAARLAERVATMTPAEKIKTAEAHIGAGFSAFLLMDGLKRIGEHKEAGTLASIPKTIAVATWVETVKQTALAGSINFPPAPHTFEEVVAES
jgi:hypothetical protein